MKKVKAVSLFAGAGGMDLGFIKQGFDVVWAVDNDGGACETYRENIGDHIICEDITKVKSEDIPDCSLIYGGNPCQGFSSANRRTGFINNPKNFLVKEYIRIVKDKQPEVFVLENVPQILTAGKGQFLREIKEELHMYHIEASVLTASNYEVPQTRRRAILIGSKNGIIKHPLPTVSKEKTVGDGFEGIHNDLYNQLDRIKHSEIVLKRIKSVPSGGNIKNIPEHIRPKGSHSNVYKRLELDKPSITIAHVRKAMIIHPTENRVLSVREAARLQSFPDDFVFHSGLASKFQQVANAVPPLMAEAIAKEVKKYFESK